MEATGQILDPGLKARPPVLGGTLLQPLFATTISSPGRHCFPSWGSLTFPPSSSVIPKGQSLEVCLASSYLEEPLV